MFSWSSFCCSSCFMRWAIIISVWLRRRWPTGSKWRRTSHLRWNNTLSLLVWLACYARLPDMTPAALGAMKYLRGTLAGRSLSGWIGPRGEGGRASGSDSIFYTLLYYIFTLLYFVVCGDIRLYWLYNNILFIYIYIYIISVLHYSSFYEVTCATVSGRAQQFRFSNTVLNRTVLSFEF